MEPAIDHVEDVLRHCGGRLTTHDADLLYRSAAEIKPQNILEIGCMDGCSTMVLGSLLKQLDTGGRIQCIEPAPKQKWRHNIDRLGLQPWVHMHFASSPWISYEKIIATCVEPLVDKTKPIDYLFIDGDHRTRWAIVDYHYYMPFVRIGGRIGFHDWWDQHDAGKWVREAVEIILRDDKDTVLKMVEETRNKRGYIVFEKVGDHNRYR